EHLGVKRIVLVGHSTGGMLAARYALLYPGESSRWCSSIRSVWRTGRASASPGAAWTPGTREAGAADDRAEGQHRDRQGRRPAGAEEEARELSEPRPRGCPAVSARDPRRVSRARACAADPGSGAVPPGAAEGNQIASASTTYRTGKNTRTVAKASSLRRSSRRGACRGRQSRVGGAVPLGFVGACCEGLAFVLLESHTRPRLRPKRLTLSAHAASNAGGAVCSSQRATGLLRANQH